MLTIINHLIDTIFPPRETERLVRALTETTMQNLYRPTPYSIATALTPYTNPTIKALITENKYYRNTRAAALLANLLEQWSQTQHRNIVCIPMPQSSLRARERGYNQVALILAHTTSCISNPNILRRTKETTSQTNLNKIKRNENMRDAFVCEPGEIASHTDTTFVIIDDVITTGATMRAARSALESHLPASCSVICVALAH